MARPLAPMAGGSDGQPAANRSRKPVVAGAIAVAIAVAAAVAIGVNLTAAAPHAIDEKTFPDAVVRGYVAENADGDHDGSLSLAEAEAVESIALGLTETASIDGLELFPNLRELFLPECGNLVQADFSKLPSLEKLDVSYTPLKSLDVSGLKDLKELDAVYCGGLSQVSLGGAPVLEKADFSDSSVVSVDVTGNSQLADLKVGDDVEVSGLESSKLREQWLLVAYDVDGSRGALDINGAGDVVDGVHDAFSYDEDNQLVEATLEETYSPGSESSSTVTWTYENGRPVAKEQTGNNGEDATYSYDELGRIATKSSTRSSGKSSWSNDSTFEYDASGLLTAVVESQEGVGVEVDYDYDEAGHLVKMTPSESIGGAKNSVAYEYDGQGRLTAEKSLYHQFVYGYDNGVCTEKVGYTFASAGAEPQKWFTVSFAYDEQGRIKTATRAYDSTDMTLTAECVYDAHGNMAEVKLMRTDGSSGNTYTSSKAYTYTRVLTAADAPDVFRPIVEADPTAFSKFVEPTFASLMPDQSTVCGYYNGAEGVSTL